MLIRGISTGSNDSDEEEEEEDVDDEDTSKYTAEQMSTLRVVSTKSGKTGWTKCEGFSSATRPTAAF
jgi:hypothetical protein